MNVIAWGTSTTGGTNVPASATNVIAIASGYSHALALRDDHTVVAWGYANFPMVVPPPEDLTNAVAIAGGYWHSLALRSDGTVLGWSQYVPDCGDASIPPAGLSNVIEIAAGYGMSIALRADGSVVTWGCNPIQPPSKVTNIIHVACGDGFWLGLKSDGRVVSWGSNAPTVPTGLSNVVAISLMGRRYLALKENGTIGWSLAPAPPAGLSNVIGIAAGTSFSVAVKADGTVAQWGDESNMPQPASGMPFVSQVAAGLRFAIARVDLARTNPPPRIVTQPASQNAGIGSDVRLFVFASGYGLSYQWLFDGTNLIAGATNSFLALTNVQTSDSGSYSVIVSNSGGSVLSQPATLNVLALLGIDMVPAINLIGDVGRDYQLEFANMVGPSSWEVLTTLTITNRPQKYVDLTAIGQPKRVYRLVLLP